MEAKACCDEAKACCHDEAASTVKSCCDSVEPATGQL
jgi:hypothetical protein